MVKAYSSHGLDRKYKPWRKGKSAHHKNNNGGGGGSLKHRLRGQERLLARHNANSNNNDPQMQKAIQDKIDALKQEIQHKQSIEKVRKHAKKSHGKRFLERQKLARMQLKASSTTADDDEELQLTRIALDQVYVAHYPLQQRYKPLFRNGRRIVDDNTSRAALASSSKQLVQRARIRHQILQSLAATSEPKQQQQQQRVAWIAPQQYQRVPTSWSVEQERAMFGCYCQEEEESNVAADMDTDSRFAALESSAQHQALLQKAEQIESQLEREEEDLEKQKQQQQQKEADNKNSSKKDDTDDDDSSTSSDGSSSSSSSNQSSEDDSTVEADPLAESQRRLKESKRRQEHHQDDSGSDSDSDSSSSSSSSTDSSSSSSSSEDDDIDSNQDNHEQEKPSQNYSIIIIKDDQQQQAPLSTTNNNNNNNNKHTAMVNDEKKKNNKINNNNNNDWEDDDFFVVVPSAAAAVAATSDNDDDNHVNDNVFDQRGTGQLSGFEPTAKGDKSQGWATQRQRPGQFRKKQRRY